MTCFVPTPLPKWKQLARWVARWGIGLLLGLLLLTLAALGVPAASAPKRVLLLFHEAAHLPTDITLEQAVRSQLKNPEDDRIEIYTE